MSIPFNSSYFQPGNVAPSESRPVVALAVLQQGQSALMQLRDDLPNILYPGHWGLFGGHVEPGETPEQAIQRELLEEIHYCPPDLVLVGRHDDAVIRFVYKAPLTVDLTQLVQGEGMDMALVGLEDLQRGDRYSQAIQQTRPMAPPARAILLRFMAPEITLQVNGETRTTPPQTPLPLFLEQLGLNPRLVAVEYNGEILHRQFWETTEMKPDDCLEIVTIVGGG
jgi:8-oxo-dGTP diphosphatase